MKHLNNFSSQRRLNLIPQWTIVWIFALAFSGQVAQAAESVKCEKGGKSKWHKVWKIYGSVKDMPEILENEGVHILDFPPSIWEDRQAVDIAWAAKDWCKVKYLMGAVDSAFSRIPSAELTPDEFGRFVIEKFRRLEAWYRVASLSAQINAEGYLKHGVAQLADGKFLEASQQFNRALNHVFKLENNWQIPQLLPTVSIKGHKQAELNPDEIVAGCPDLGATVTKEEYETILAKMSKVFNERLLRPVDLKDATDLIADFSNYYRLGVMAAAARVGCVLIKRAGEFDVDLGTVMRRYQLVNQLQQEKTLPKYRRREFKKFVRLASDHLAQSRFQLAHQSLEKVFVLFGEPVSPSSYLMGAPDSPKHLKGPKR
ncbi:MAG: hypothetical protein VYA34_01475 [Myxococcota bacterium]|nr:hypothetical protein [Myxococcota bacterium]